MTARLGFLTFTFVTFGGLSVHAYPDIGDKVTWSGDFKTADGKTSEIHITKEIIGFEKETKKWKVKVDTKVGSESQSETFETTDLFTPQKFKDLITHCAKNGGVIQTLQTNPGKYETCKMTTIEEGVVIEKWWGDIPFGVVSKATRNSNGLATNESPLKVATRGL